MRPGGERPAAPPAAGAGPRARLWSVARGGGGAGQRRLAVLFARASRAPRLWRAVGAPGGIPGGPTPPPVPGAASIPQPDAPEGLPVASLRRAGPAAAAEACRRGTARAPHGFAVSTSLSGFCPFFFFFFLPGVLTRELFSTGRPRGACRRARVRSGGDGWARRPRPHPGLPRACRPAAPAARGGRGAGSRARGPARGCSGCSSCGSHLRRGVRGSDPAAPPSCLGAGEGCSQSPSPGLVRRASGSEKRALAAGLCAAAPSARQW